MAPDSKAEWLTSFCSGQIKASKAASQRMIAQCLKFLKSPRTGCPFTVCLGRSIDKGQICRRKRAKNGCLELFV